MDSWPRFEVPQAVPSKGNMGFVLVWTSNDGQTHEHGFRCLDVPPAGVWRGITGDGLVAHSSVIAFIEGVIASDEDLALFRSLIDPANREVTVDVNYLGQIVGTLATLYSNRPTTPSAASTNGQLTTGTSSTDGASTEESIS